MTNSDQGNKSDFPICNICDAEILNSSFVNCDSFYCRQHFQCVKIPKTESKALQIKGPQKLRYFCENCLKRLQCLPKVLNSLSDIQQKFDRFAQKIQDISDNQIKARDEFNALKDRTSALEITLSKYSPNDQTVAVDVIAEEIADGQRRTSNLIVYNPKESSNLNISKRVEEDSNATKKILFDILTKDVPIKSMLRLGIS